MARSQYPQTTRSLLKTGLLLIYYITILFAQQIKIIISNPFPQLLVSHDQKKNLDIIILIQYISRKLVNFFKTLFNLSHETHPDSGIRAHNAPSSFRKAGHFAPTPTNPKGSYFRKSGGFPILPIRRGPNFADPEGSYFRQSGGVPVLPIRKGPIFANPEGIYFCQSGGVLFSPIRTGPVFANPGGSIIVKT